MTRPSWQDFGTHDESACPELWDGVIGAWAPCLGPTGSRLHDMSRRANWGTLTNMDPPTDWVVSDGQYALDFDGANDEVACGNIRELDQAIWFAISVWYRAANVTQTGGLLKQWDAARGVYVFTSGTTLIFQIGFLSNRLQASAALTANQWDHFVCVAGTNRMEIHRNGILIASKDSQPEPISSHGQPWNFCNNVGGTSFVAGRIDDTAVWNRRLSSNEIRQLYQLGRGGMYQRRRRRAIYLPQAGFQSAWARGSNVLLGFNQP